MSFFPHQIHQLFAILFTTCFSSQASVLWDKYKNSMSDDILHHIWITDQDPNINFSPEIYNEALIKIEDIYILISNMQLIHLGMSPHLTPQQKI